MITPVLSILIPSTSDRDGLLGKLLFDLSKQIEENNAEKLVEIITDVDNYERTTGAKRNDLLERSKGIFVVAIDSDDEVSPYYIKEILLAAESDCDAIGITGWMTTNGRNLRKWDISKDHDYIMILDEDGKELYLRFNNHISPIKRSIAIQFKFPDKNFGEDYEWAVQINKSGLIKKETKIIPPLYHYKYIKK
ncbi:MAG: glycosyltransferase family A protein [Bacteroidia bacterium]